MSDHPPSDPELARAVAVLRRFNRTHTQRVGALDESFLSSGRTLGQSRLLFEIGPGGAAVSDLRARLGLDSGYVSRLIRALEADGLVISFPDPDDGRRRLVDLSPHGRRAWELLDRRSDELATSLVASLDRRRRAELAHVLDRADRLLLAATVTVEVVDPRSDDAVAALQCYFAELDERFARGFDPGDSLLADAPSFSEPHGVFLVVRADTRAIACGGLQRVDDATAEIKRMWVHPDWRGLGLGARTLSELESRAVERGDRRIVLDTNATLTQAISMYERSGYRPIERYNDNPYAERWFAKELGEASVD